MPDPATAGDAVACIRRSSQPRRGTKFVARSILTVLMLSHFELIVTSTRAIVFAASGHADGEVYGQQSTRPGQTGQKRHRGAARDRGGAGCYTGECDNGIQNQKAPTD